jgi:hypothetical protein
VDATTAAAITAGGVGGGHWTSLSEVTLGGSAVSAIDITLPSGYDKHLIDFVIPTVASGTAGSALRLNILNSGTAQYYHYTGMYTDNYAQRNQSENVTEMSYVPDVGDFFVGYPTFIHSTIEVFDASSSSLATRYLFRGGGGAEVGNEALYVAGQGKQVTPATSSTLRFKWQAGSNFATGSGFYYRLYGHSYS